MPIRRRVIGLARRIGTLERRISANDAMSPSVATRARNLLLAVAFAFTAFGANSSQPAPARAATVHTPGFQHTTVISGLTQPAAVEFAPDGRVFVIETAGVIKAFDSINDPTPTTVANMTSQVHAIGDRGMLGLALDPGFGSGRPYLYVTYTQDAPPGGTPPYYNDDCPRDPETGAANRCPATGRLVRIGVNANNQKTSELILIGGTGDNFWCHHARAHAVGHAAFGPDGALYVSSGEGSAAIGTDYGQQPNPANPCGDPPAPVGTALSVPTTEGGSLRSQELRTSGDPAQGSGAIVRVNPDTGAAMAGNPLIGNAFPTDDRHIAYGLRNPFRFTFRPGTSEIWIADVGWNTREEVNRILNPTDAKVENFGWPCYEGAARQAAWDALNVNICEGLYAAGAGAVTAPYWHYGRNASSPGAPECRSAGAAPSAIAFSEGAPFPAAYNGALFVGDYVMGCIWALRAGSNGLPSADEPRHHRQRGDAGRARDRPGRRALRGRYRRRHDRSDHLLRRKPAASRAGDRFAELRTGAADGRVQRVGLD